MKKYIALAALLAAGSALANAEADLSNKAVNDALAEALLTTNYQFGDAFTLNLTVGTDDMDGYTSDWVLILSKDGAGSATDWGVFSQAGDYVAMDNTAANDRSWVAPTSTEGTVFTWTTSDGVKLDSWVSKNSTGGNASPGIEGMGITVLCDGTNSTITLDMTNGTTSVIQANGLVLDANDIELGSHITTIKELGSFAANGITAAIPEPSTFGLLAGLGALALVGARRRRR